MSKRNVEPRETEPTVDTDKPMGELEKEVMVKHPNLKKLMAELLAKKAPLALLRNEVRKELDALTQNPRITELRNKMKEINTELGPIDNELAALARALGPKGIKAESGTYNKGE